MRSVFFSLLALVALACSSSAAPASPTPSLRPSTPPVAITITGVVTDLDTGKPVEGLCVTLGKPGAFCWATTDAKGAYTINGTGIVEPSQTEWELYFAKPGVYTPQPSGRFKLTGGNVRVDGGVKRQP